jgi:hypothetical protein
MKVREETAKLAARKGYKLPYLVPEDTWKSFIRFGKEASKNRAQSVSVSKSVEDIQTMCATYPDYGMTE